MYLSKLEIHGFKSFAASTVLRFGPGVTAIVGPNGCGKSNVVDAVRWVIGEQRARVLRSEKMENIIFNGAARRRPLGLAEVQLTIENTRGALPTQYAEVTLGRRLYRSGDSEYLLNGAPCRLRDVVDLFLDTGMGAGAYSVIELKMIEEILSDSALDRRRLFEEAAGVTKYKLRRAQALRKLESTQADLVRLRDVTEEIARRVQRLQRQAATASRYGRRRARAAKLALKLAQIDYCRLLEEDGSLAKRVGRLSDTLVRHSAQIAGDEASREVLRARLLEEEHALGESQGRLSDHISRERDLAADIRLERERSQAATRDMERMRREQHGARERLGTLAADLITLAAKISEAEPSREEAQQALDNARASRDGARALAHARRSALKDLQNREQRLRGERARHQRSFDQISARLEFLGEEQARLCEQTALSQAFGGELSAKEQEAGARLSTAEAALAEARTCLQDAEERYEALERDVEEARRRRRQLEREQSVKTAEAELLDGFLTSNDDLPEAVAFLTGDTSWTKSPVKTASDLLTCAAPFRAALAAALGPYGACLVTRTDQELRGATALLRDEQKGRALFFVMERLKAPSHTAPPRAWRPLLDVVQTSASAYAPLAQLLLRDIFLVDTLEEARTLPGGEAPEGARFVTASGEWIDARGFVHAGGRFAGASLERMDRRDRLDTTRISLLELEGRLERFSEALRELRDARDAIAVEESRARVALAKSAAGDARRDLSRITDAREAASRRERELKERMESLEAESRDATEAVRAPEAAALKSEITLEELRQSLAEGEATLQEADIEREAAQDQFTSARVATADASASCESLVRERARVRDQSAALEGRTAERQSHIVSLQETRDVAQQAVARLEEQLEAERSRNASLESALSADKTRVLETRVNIDRFESSLRKARKAREEIQSEEHALTVRRATLEVRAEELLSTVREEYGRELGAISLETDVDEEAIRKELHQLQEKIKAMGVVNALALEEYESEKERHTFMAAQCEDLERAETTLLKTISEINVAAGKRFMGTFEAIRKSFGDLFVELFGADASASLELVDPSDPLQTPIAVMAQPRGKRPIHISQLSSGEKTLTAIALLFAIYLIKPSPFCFLDEVDAPLDEANIDRFMRLIRRFSLDTQFILVTHNKRTMEMADRLYGITMQEQGVSRLVGVRFEEAMALAS